MNRSTRRRGERTGSFDRGHTHNFRQVAVVAALSAVLLVLLGASSAQAAVSRSYSAALSHSGYGDACTTVVDSNGDVYVGDYSGAISIYDPAGALITTTEAVSQACGLAVDSAGDLYVNSWQGQVTKLNPSAFPVTAATTYGPDASVNGNGVLASGTNYAVAVDPVTQNVYVSSGEQISEYEPDGTLLSATIGTGVPGALYFGVDVYGANGDVYANDGEHASTYIFDAADLAGPPAVTIDGSNTPAGSIGFGTYGAQLAADQSNGHAFVFDTEHLLVDEFDASGAYVGALSHEFGDGEPSDVAVDNSGSAADGNVYVAAHASLSAFTPRPVGEGEVATHITDTSVRLEGKVSPGGQATTYQFEYLTEAAYHANGNSFSGPQSPARVPAVPASIGAGGAAIPVAEEVGGLLPATTYRFRLAVSSPAGSSTGPGAAFTTFTRSPGLGPCANEALRGGPGASLPDCRAYEQATPVDKNGGNPQATTLPLKASINGDGVTFASNAGFPGGSGAQGLPLYLASRGGGGWSTQGLLPPASAGDSGNITGWTPDFSQVFDLAEKLGERRATLLSRARSGALSTIVPYTTAGINPFFAGASADGSKVVFEDNAKLLPAAIEGESNVYLWDKASGQLSLAGVLNDGNAPAAGAFAGSYDWVKGISPATLGKGGSAAFYYTQNQHVVSMAGSVYFTAAGSGALYLRRNPAATQSPLDGNGKCANPTLACTIEVSASQKTNGAGAGGRDINGTQPAAFMGASADGSKAFFTSSEKLTNDATTGPEPSPAAIARANLDGTGADLGFLPASASGVAVDGAHVYWADSTKGAIGRANLNGTGVEAEFIAGAGDPQWVAVDGGHIYWTNNAEEASEGEGKGAIGRANLNGTGVEAEFIAGASNPQGIAANATHIYWANDGTHSIARAALDGSSPETELASVSPDFDMHGIALNATHVYFTLTEANGFIGRANLDGTELELVTVFLNGAKGLRGLAVDGSHLYWTNQAANTIGRAGLDGTGREEEFISSAGLPQGVAVDAGHIYWSANQERVPNPGNDLYRYDANSDTLTDLVPDSADPNGAQVKGLLGTSEDGSYVYFAANGVLAAGATPGDCQGSPQGGSGSCNLYLFHEGAISFITRLEATQFESVTDGTNWTGYVGTFEEKTARVTPDGRTLLFRSHRQIGAYDNEGRPELYRYRVGDPDPICISCDPTGTAPVSAATLGDIKPPVRTEASPAAVLFRNLSSDGRRVFFETADALLPADTNGGDGCPVVGTQIQKFNSCQDVYEWEANGSGSCHGTDQNGGCLYLISTGKSSEPSFFADASASGDDVFIFTTSKLVGQDKDSLVDVYDARVGGGLVSQNQLEVAPCTGEACRAPSSPAPGPQTPGSSSFSGPGNVKPALHKPKKKHKHHKRKHKQKHHKRAHAKGRAQR